MELVTTDLDGKSSWYYDAGTATYRRVLPDGETATLGGGKMLAHLSGRDIPNPDSLWTARCTMANVNPDSPDAEKFKPSPVTYALYAHWQGVNNA